MAGDSLPFSSSDLGHPVLVTSASPGEDPPRVTRGLQKGILGLLVLASFVALGDFLGWLWHREPGFVPRELSFSLGLIFLLIPLFHLGMSWVFSLGFRIRSSPRPRQDLSVDVFVTVVDEPRELIESTLRAAVEIEYPHRTWLLHDGEDPEMEALAHRLGAEYLRREGKDDLKAGNLNHALEQTSGEFVAIFDVDHRPRKDFLHRTLGHFEDSQVGFVQAMLTFSNAHKGLIARASTQTAYDYYNVSAVGKDRLGAASLMGSNAVIRRTALERIGGYRPGLAEDLETSVALHADHWSSVYVRESLAPGLSPADLPAFYKQQLKWSRGVFEAGLRSLGGSFFEFSGLQKLCYLTRFTYYALGALVFVQMALIVLALIWPGLPLEEAIWHFLPLTVLAYFSKVLPLRFWALERDARRGFLFKGASLFITTWPMYLLAAVCAVLRIPIPFMDTPKVMTRRLPSWAYVPQLVMLGVLSSAVAWRFSQWDIEPMPVTVGLAFFFIASHWILLWVLAQNLVARLSR